MDLGLNGKVAAVTASSQGIGKAIAMELAQEGAKVAICARRQDRSTKRRRRSKRRAARCFRALPT